MDSDVVRGPAGSAVGRGCPAPEPGPPTRGVWGPTCVVAVGVVVIALSGIRGADYPAHLLRALLWDQSGAGVWNTYWYAGHPTPTYSVITPPLTATVGAFVVIAASSLVAVWCFARLTTTVLATPSTTLANHAFAAVALVNVIVGRVPFGLGLALAMAALWCWYRGWMVPALACALLTPLASPVAATFLAIATLARALGRARSGRLVQLPANQRIVVQGSALTAAALIPVVTLALLYHSPGRFPFRADQLAVSLLVGGVLVVAIRVPAVRIATAMAVVSSVGLFLVPNPLGGNFLRLAQLVAVPLAITAVGSVRSKHVPGFVALILVGTVWSVQPGVAAAIDWMGDESGDADFHQPLIDELHRRNADGSPLGRVEIPFTDNHWESYFVAPEVPYARGWERQVDLDRNDELYDDDLTLGEYHRWVRDNAIRWIAVPDVDLDEGGRAEGDLLAREGTSRDIAWLEPVWSNDDWQLYEVTDYQPIVELPAQLVEQDTDYFVVRVSEPAQVTIRFEYVDDLSVSGLACIDRHPDGWIEARLLAPGDFEFRVDAGAALPGGDTDECLHLDGTARPST